MALPVLPTPTSTSDYPLLLSNGRHMLQAIMKDDRYFERYLLKGSKEGFLVYADHYLDRYQIFFCVKKRLIFYSKMALPCMSREEIF